MLDDENRRRTLGRAAQEWVSARYNWDRLVNQIELLYDELAG